MNLKNLSDQVLLADAERLVAEERELLIVILRHLREIERRRLFSALGFKSLFEYAVKRLKYSEDQAGRRISAMRLMKELPEIEEKIESGSLTLTNLGLAQRLFRQEAKVQAVSKDEKVAILARLENSSKREAEKIVLAESSDPAVLKPDHVRAVTESQVEIKFIAAQALLAKIEKLKGLLAHTHPNMSMAELMDKLCDLGINKYDPAAKFAVRDNKKVKVPTPAPERREGDTFRVHGARALRKRIAISSPQRQEVWHQAGGKCQACGSNHALQVDHKNPVARGGGNEPENLRLLCRTCNQRAAIDKLGLNKMSWYFDSPMDG